MADAEKVIVADGAKHGSRRSFLYRYYSGADGSSGRNLFSALLLLLLLVGTVFLILYLVNRPSRPRFSVTAASLLSLRPSPDSHPAVVSASLQLTLVARNPSDRATVLYDRLSAYVAYRGEPITPPVPLPPLVQEADSTVAVSPVVGPGGGEDQYVAVSSDAAAGLERDRAYGVMGLRLVVVGRVKYKYGPFRSGWNGLYVGCNMLLGVRNGVVGPVPLIGEPQCSVDA